MRRWALLTALIASPAGAGDLLFPADCLLGETCYIQQYVDRNPGAGIADFTCGPLTYDGHRGTDIALPDMAAMRAGVSVLSASSGNVLGVRDGMADRLYNRQSAPDLKGRDCGNGVLVERQDGWRFQYCHLRQGSVVVSKGDTVEAGQVLGQIGLSGRTQFPHVHLTIRDQAGRVIDPFDARQQNESCSLRDQRSLWRGLSALDYVPGGPLAAGFHSRIPDYSEVLEGAAHLTPGRNADALVFWAHFFGLKSGDVIELVLTGPAGEVVSQSRHRMTSNRAREFRAAGRKRRGVAWPAGTYKGRADLRRGSSIIASIEADITLD